jgi:hypothetical protein
VDERDAEKEAVHTLTQIVMSVFDGMEDIKSMNVLQVARKLITEERAKFSGEIRQLRKKILHWQEGRRRIKARKDNFLEAAFNQTIASIEDAIQQREWKLEVGTLMLKLLDDFEYQTDNPMPAFSMTSLNFEEWTKVR